MPADTLITRLLLTAARRKGPAVELRCRALLERMISGRELHTALQCELAHGGLTESGFLVMATLLALEPAALLRSELPVATGLSRVRAEEALTRLEMSGLVRRQRDDRDRRVVRLQLTPAGRTQAIAVVQRLVAGAARLTGGLNESELEASIEMSGKLRTGAARLTDKAAASALAGGRR